MVNHESDSVAIPDFFSPAEILPDEAVFAPPPAAKPVPRKPSTKIPSLCHHKGTGQGFVVLNEKFFYLGAWGEQETVEAYNLKITDWLAHGRRQPIPQHQITVAEVADQFHEFAMSYYRNPEGKLSTEVDNIRLSMRPVLQLYDVLPAAKFDSVALLLVRERMLAENLVRTNINKRINRIRLVFRWAASRKLVPPGIVADLLNVDGLPVGRQGSREGKQVHPAPQHLIEAVKPFVSPQVWAIIQLQLQTGARPGEILIMRPMDIDRSTSVWDYKPYDYKTKYLGHERDIFIGPRAQAVLTPFLQRSDDRYCFSPQEAENDRYDRQRREIMENPNWHAKGARKKIRRRPKTPRKLGDIYTVDGYRRAVTRALEQAYPTPKHLRRKKLTFPGMRKGVSKCRMETVAEYKKRLKPKLYAEMKAFRLRYHWHPHQLRHNAATDIRREFGLEAAQTILGHQSVSVTEMYAEKDKEKAMAAMAKFG